VGYPSAPTFEAQPFYVSANGGAMPVPETSSSGPSLSSGVAFVAGLTVTFAALTHHAKKAAAKKHHDQLTTFEQNQMTTYEHILEGQTSLTSDPERKIAMLAALGADDFVPDMQRRTIMNLVLLGGAAVPVGWLAGGFIYFFVPPGGGGGGAGVVAKDALGDAVTKAGWTKSHQPGDRQLVQGLKGDAHYLIVEGDGSIRDYALNAVCTHLGCVVPWNRAANKFMCPCHGSQYDETGKVVRGPAPLSLALAHLDIDDKDQVVLSAWTETDFRTNLAPWWKS